jgi:hypothetical protein
VNFSARLGGDREPGAGKELPNGWAYVHRVDPRILVVLREWEQRWVLDRKCKDDIIQKIGACDFFLVVVYENSY